MSDSTVIMPDRRADRRRCLRCGHHETCGWPRGRATRCQTGDMPPRFLTLADVTEVLNISATQAYALVRSGELPAIQVGAKGVWRVEATELEAYIQRMYEQARARISSGEVDRATTGSGAADDLKG
jgi:excisionase family DNA binding protein